MLQALRCMSIYMARIFMALILAIVYGTTYVNLSTSDSGWYQRTTIFFIVCAVVPLFSITCLPAYDNLTRVSSAFVSFLNRPQIHMAIWLIAVM